MQNHEHRFYSKTKRQRRTIQVSIGASAVVLNAAVAWMAFATDLYPLPFLSIALTFSIVAPFFDVPSLKERGQLIYYSPLFLAEREKEGVITIHGGTLLDYIYAVDHSLNGRLRTNQVLLGYVDGLLNLLESHRDCDRDQLRVRGTSYVINERTANMIGLVRVPTSFVQTIILLYNYLNISLCYSIAKARLSFPRFRGIGTYEGTLSNIAANKAALIRLKRRLEAG
ncbi:MAG: hypothetical protein GF341_00330 [candidate division Zixibacteria bacterium]|nr:hypothetical protein [candidate division Zixibacteria bacterium]